jgi:D-glycero-D-manno-heptose 1,7-bisphosphate phosphatase
MLNWKGWSVASDFSEIVENNGSSQMTKILFCDLDGTLRRPKSGAKFINDPQDQEPMPGAINCLAHYHQHGFRLIGVTNQGGVAAGHKSLADATLEQLITLQLFPTLSLIYFCPDYEGLSCWKVARDGHRQIKQIGFPTPEFGSFRKPGPGMINLCLQSPDLPSVSLSDCFMIGDRDEDLGAATAAGINFFWAESFITPFLGVE